MLQLKEQSLTGWMKIIFRESCAVLSEKWGWRLNSYLYFKNTKSSCHWNYQWGNISHSFLLFVFIGSCLAVQHSELLSESQGEELQIYFHKWRVPAFHVFEVCLYTYNLNKLTAEREGKKENRGTKTYTYLTTTTSLKMTH